MAASYRRTASGKWECRYWTIGGDGQRRFFQFTRATKREAEQEYERRRGDLEAGGGGAPSRMTVAALAERWLVEKRATVKASTWTRYDVSWRHQIAPALQGVRLCDLTIEHVLSWKRWLEDRPLAPRTRHHAHRALSDLLETAVTWRLLGWNPVSRVQAPRVDRRERPTLTVPEVRRVLVACADEDLGPVVALLLLTGMRIGEGLGLGWADVDLDRAEILVRRALVLAGPDRGLVTEPKRHSVRSLPVPGMLIRMLREHRARQLEQRLRVGAGYEDQGLVFATALGQPWSYTAAWKCWDRIKHAAGIERPVTLHDLRHSHATVALAMGESIGVVSERLGHSSKDFTWRVYGHVLPGAGRDFADRLDSVFDLNGGRTAI